MWQQFIWQLSAEHRQRNWTPCHCLRTSPTSHGNGKWVTGSWFLVFKIPFITCYIIAAQIVAWLFCCFVSAVLFLMRSVMNCICGCNGIYQPDRPLGRTCILWISCVVFLLSMCQWFWSCVCWEWGALSLAGCLSPSSPPNAPKLAVGDRAWEGESRLV